jgi:hypothetical protein
MDGWIDGWMDESFRLSIGYQCQGTNGVCVLLMYVWSRCCSVSLFFPFVLFFFSRALPLLLELLCLREVSAVFAVWQLF